MKNFLIFATVFIGRVAALDVQPWFGEVYQFYFLSSYSYSWFHSVQNAKPPYNKFFYENLLYFDLDFTLAPSWSVDADLQFADTTAVSPSFRSAALQGRYLWFDDIVGDPVSFATGISARGTSSYALSDVSCPSHGNLDIELNLSLGKEFVSGCSWRYRLWAYGAVGQANRGSPWVNAILAAEMNHRDTHKWALYACGTSAYGRETHINVEHFFGYAKIRERLIDLGVRYGYRMGVWGTFRFDYLYRVLAKSAPENVNSVAVSWLIPFGL
ncbi:MAG: hypothetical protein KGI80_02375 [Verrucomicrobiota bacterium]|nr:hypothetical protein [Verrucomicrobiota bacterium]